MTQPNAAHDRRIDYIELPSNDLARSKAFYAGVFGWTFTDYGPDYTCFHDGRLGGGFTNDRVARTGGGPLLVFYVADLEAAQRRVVEHGGTIAQPIVSFPGGRRFHFLDPSGTELAIWSEERPI
ncbi:MAG: bleomycin resistance protein [Phycisphaerae bacterium]|nr:MAG: bleomycin resistance protein [Phycisphaerae bacterium]